MPEDQSRDRTGTITVLLVDNHTLFRQGLARILDDYAGMKVVGQTNNDDEAVELARRTKPDVVLMEVPLPLSKAKANLERMSQIDPTPKMIIVTMIEDPIYVRELVELQVSAYIVKSASAEHLIAAVRTAILDPKSENVVVGMPLEMLDKAKTGSESILSARELEILLLAARGLSNRQISQYLYSAESTIKRHLANIYEKIEVHSRGEATRKALFEEWITVQDITDDLDEREIKE